MDAFIVNVKPVLFEMDAFQQRLFNSQRETFFAEPFLFDTMPPRWMPL